MKVRTFLLVVFVAAAVLFAVEFNAIELSASAGQSAEQRPPMFVLQIGIGKYLNAPKWTDLRGSVNDVLEMRKVLEGDRFRVAPENIATLTNEKATKQGIFAAFQANLIAKAKNYYESTKRRDAVVLFQFSGHGSQAPDADGDEADNLDETLVTYDSKDEKGKNFDITDDEIFALTSVLKQYTDNIVYVFDSCHSGSGTRSAEDARRLPARTTVPEPIPMPGIATRSGRADDGSDGSVLPPGNDYVVISAAHADQLATQKYCFEECGSDKEPVVYGLLTYYLIDELKNARSDTSYRELMANVARKVEAERPSQIPLIEGDERRTVFGALGNSDDAYVRISAVDPTSIKIRAGAIQGVSAGTIVAIYDQRVSKFDSAEKIATGRVAALTPTESTVHIVSQKRPLTNGDKAVAASPDFGTSRIKLWIDSPADSALAKAIRESFSPKAAASAARGVDVLSDSVVNRQTGRWNIAVLKDKFSKVFPGSGGGRPAPDCKPASSEISLNSEVYYIAGPDYVPLFGFCVEAQSNSLRQSEAADAIVKALTHIARYRSIQQIQNRRSRLAGKVVVKPIRLGTKDGSFSGRANCVDGKFVVDTYETVALSTPGRYLFGAGEVFWFEVTNNSPFDLYVSMLNLRSDGSIKLQFPRNIDEEKNGVLIPNNGGKRIVNSDRCRLNADGDFLDTGAFRTAGEPENDAFKFLITTSRLTWGDLSYLEMDALTRNENASLATINEWIAIDLTFEVGGQKKL